MTAIYGLARFAGTAVTASELAGMASPIRYWGPDGGGAWTSPDGAAGLGQLVSHNLPESGREHGPLTLADGSVVTVAARLDNRDELLLLLGLASGVTESQIVAAAWEKWRTDAPLNLYGDWSFAVWEPASRRLFVARDQFGNTALYHHRSTDTFAFASSRKALFALPFVPRRLNELRLAQHLATWITDGEATFHEEIFRLPAGYHLIASADGVRITRYWNPEQLPEVRLSTDDEYVERFLELYSTAVRVRTRTTRLVAGTLSSGLDSSSVIALAARELRRHGKALTAFTSVPLYPEIAATMPRTLVDEGPVASSIADWIGGVDHRCLSAASTSPLASLERSLWLHDEPEYAAGNLYWIIDLFEQCQQAGAGVLLTGQMGNGGVSWSGDQLRVLRGMRSGHWIDAWNGLRAFQRLRSLSLLRAAWIQVVGPLKATIASARFRRGRLGLPHAEALFAPAFLERMALYDRIRSDGYDPFFSEILDLRAQRSRILLPGINPIGALWHESGAGYGLEVRDPTADVRLLEYCFGVPDEQYVRSGHDRYLIRRGLEGLVPPQVQWSQRRGRQAADLVLRLKADAPALGAAVEEVASSARVREYVNVDGIVGAWREIRDGDGRTPLITGYTLARSLLISLFLAREPFE